MDPIVVVEQAANVSLEEGPIHNDLASKIQAFSEMVDAKGVKVGTKVTEAISLWTTFHKSLHDDSVENFIDLFDKLYLYSARLILQGSWYEAITKNDNNNAEDYKNELLQPLNGIIQDAISTYPAKVELCRSLKPLVESPWGLPHIKEILSYKDLKTSFSSVDTLWEQENAVLLKVRIEYLCSAKMFDQAFALAHACYLKGYWTYDDPNPPQSNNVDSQYNVYTKELYFQFTDILYLLLCRLNSTAKYQDILSVPTALEVVERLTTDSEKIAPKWKEWKKAHKTIVVAIAEFLTNQNQMQVDANALKSLFAHWIRCTSKSDEDEEIRPVKEVLSRISLIQTDYAYELANAILENFPSRPYAGIKFVEIYIRALNKDINQFQSLEVTENHDPELTKSFHQKLAQRYLRMADVFRASDNERSFQMMLTAFSLHPSETLYEHLFETNNNSDENNDIASKSEIVIENSPFYDKPIELTSDLKEDLQTVTTGCRLGSLCWEKERSELKRLCRQLIDSGGLIIKAKEDLTDLHIDYTTYEPPVDEPETIYDYGFEKGYEPKDLENLFKQTYSESRKNLTKVGKTIKQKSFQRNYKRGRKPGEKFPRQAGSKYVNNYRLKKRTAQSSNDMIGSCNQQTVMGISKMRVRLGSRLKKVHVTYRKEIDGRSFVAPPDNLTIYATNFFRRMSSKESALDGDCDARWKTIIQAPSFLAEGDDTSFDSLKEKLMTTIPVEDDFSSYLVDKPIYNKLKLKCNFGKQNLRPVVVLQSEIPSDFVHNVALACAMERVIEAIQESLKLFQYGIENPLKYSPTLYSALLPHSSSDDPLSRPPLNDLQIIIPRIVQEVYNALPVQDRHLKLMSNTQSQSSRSNAIRIKPMPKSKLDKFLLNRARKYITRVLEVKSQALGLEINNVKVVHSTSQLLESLSVSSAAAGSSLTLSNNFETDAVSSTHPPENAPLSSLQSAQSMRMDGFLLSQALHKLRNLDSNNKISAPSLTARSIPSENLKALSSDEHLKLIEHSATETAVDKEKAFSSDNESATRLTTKSADINLEGQNIITDSFNSEVLEIAQMVYGNFITVDLRKESVTTLESTTMKDQSDSPESAQISDDEDFTMTPTYVEVQKQVLDSSGTRPKRRKTGHDAISFSPPPCPTPKGPKRTVARRNGRAINPPAVNNNSNEITMNDIEVSPVPQLLFPSKMPEIIEESLENHALYHEGSMFLNDQTGWMESINNEQDLYFEEYECNDTFWETWQDNFLSDTEEQIEDEWRKQIPPADVGEEESFDVGDSRLNSYTCSGPKTRRTTNEQYINIYQNPYESTPSNSASITNRLCKVYSLKDCQVSLTRLSEQEILSYMANSRESNEEIHTFKESVYDDNSKLPMEANNLLNSQYFDGQLNPINGDDDSDVESIELQKLPRHYHDLKADSEECNEEMPIVEENVEGDNSKLSMEANNLLNSQCADGQFNSINGDDNSDVELVELQELPLHYPDLKANSEECDEGVPVEEKGEEEENVDADDYNERVTVEETGEAEENVDGDNSKSSMEANNLLNSQYADRSDGQSNSINDDDNSDVELLELQELPLHYPDLKANSEECDEGVPVEEKGEEEENVDADDYNEGVTVEETGEEEENVDADDYIEGVTVEETGEEEENVDADDYIEGVTVEETGEEEENVDADDSNYEGATPTIELSSSTGRVKTSRPRKTPAKYAEYYLQSSNQFKGRKAEHPRVNGNEIVKSEEFQISVETPSKTYIESSSKIFTESCSKTSSESSSSKVNKRQMENIAVAIEAVVQRAVINANYLKPSFSEKSQNENPKRKRGHSNTLSLGESSSGKQPPNKKIAIDEDDNILPVLTPAGVILNDGVSSEDTMPTLLPES